MSMDLTSFYAQFREETTENIRILNEGLLALENADTADPAVRAQVDSIFRAMHTIKGSSRLLGFDEIGRLAHTMEDILGAMRAGKLALNRELTDLLLRSGDAISEMTGHAVEGRDAGIDIEPLVTGLTASAGAAEAPAEGAAEKPAEKPTEGAAEKPAEKPTEGAAENPAEQPAPPPQAAAAKPAEPEPEAAPAATAAPHARGRANNRQTVRVRTERLDRLINLTGELVIGQQTLNMHGDAMQDLVGMNLQQEWSLVALETELRRHSFAPNQRDTIERELNTLLNTCNQMRHLLRNQSEELARYGNQFHALVDDLEKEVITTRLLPVSTIFTTLPRAVRELANTTGKEIDLEMQGENTELDRKLLESLNDPLLHLVRNAVDHGIEPPDEREAADKPRQGHICVAAETSGGEVRITIRDDGRGLNPQKIRDSATRKGLIGSEAAAMLSDQEALDLIFLPGFSTAAILTDISGRGVGMDVVRTNISELSGQVLLESQLGVGTQVTLLLPLTLVTTRILLVQVGSQTFAFPASGCRGIIWVHADDIDTVEGRATIPHNDQTVPVLRLADLLAIEADPAFQHEDRMPAVVLGTAKRMIALLADQVLDEREAVVKSVGPLLEFERRYSGAVQLGDGSLVLMLNPMTLAQTARGVTLARPGGSTSSDRQLQRLLIADDSFTTRELIRSILSSAGYNVTAAIDGMDALDKLRAQPYDLVVSDVEMPRMNGFELTASIRQELGLDDLPVVIVTSLASDEHKRRGMEAGAQAYIVKSQFNQDNLLEAIQQLLGS